ncbi:MAG: hypothetical protein JKY65_21120 [Planctomycetes bacterium]|nr:hypothetical protein [Planctomycetota bacterium]
MNTKHPFVRRLGLQGWWEAQLVALGVGLIAISPLTCCLFPAFVGSGLLSCWLAMAPRVAQGPRAGRCLEALRVAFLSLGPIAVIAVVVGVNEGELNNLASARVPQLFPHAWVVGSDLSLAAILACWVLRRWCGGRALVRRPTRVLRREAPRKEEEFRLRLSPSKHPVRIRCPYCHDALPWAAARVVCGRCAAHHHPDCYREHRACASCAATSVALGSVPTLGSKSNLCGSAQKEVSLA